MMKLLLVLVVVALCHSTFLDNIKTYRKYKQYKVDFKKVYNGKVDLKRYNIFRKNLKDIEEHNKRFDAGEVSYSMGINQFTDMTYDEVPSCLLNIPKDNDAAQVYDNEDVSDLEDAVDWRDKGAVTPVKDQGSCFSCYAFSSTGAMEGAHQIKKGVLLSLSEQNLVDCREGTGGCEQGGFMTDCFEYVIKNKGIDTEDAYPYVGQTQQCKFNQSGIGTQLSGYKNIEKGSEEALQNAVANIGPISVAVSVTSNFHNYKSGVFEDPACEGANINHAVLAVGYGTEDGKDFWLVKNSWGERWGDKGYIKMARNKNNSCSIASLASYPIVA